MKKPLWGIDLGGTKIEGAILNPAHPEQAIQRLRVPTESANGYDHILSQFSKLITLLEEASGTKRPDRIGIGTPGVTTPRTGLIKNSNTLCLNGKALSSDLSRVLGCEAILANDANCCALAEATLGAAKGHKTVFGIILGTGVGGGIVVDGHVLSGTHGICGEWGHNPLSGEEAACYCGRQGCVEMVCAGPSLERYYAEKSGQALNLPLIVELATGGDRHAVATLERLRAKFAEALGAVVNILDPDAIVIGGGVGNLDLLYTQETRDAVCDHLFNDRFDTPLLKPSLGDSAGVFGAAMLAG
ncbi:MAG: ROK family protein [Proteobacteria bacterium]|nr:ROK family protein [Pseudomonadota bacterium]